MAIRDLGYRPYDGDRLPASQNTWVLLRHGLDRAWGSWLVKIAVFLGWGPAVVTAILLGVRFYLVKDAPPGADVGEIPGASWVSAIFWWQFWPFLSLVTVGAGAGVIAEDITFKAFAFYFAKPVTPLQYLAGRTTAVALLCFLLAFIPAAIVVGMLAGTSPEEMRLEQAGLLLPALIYALFMAIVVSTTSIGMSALSGSRALTMSAWLVLLAIPHVLALIVDAIADWPWLYVLSIWALLSRVGDALFKIETESQLGVWHALPLLVLYTAGGIAIAWRRIKNAEVIV
jgi:ABC-type transport system involved in multi-copper enzyme maturation permease subunit